MASQSKPELPAFNSSPIFRRTQNPDEGWKLGDGVRVSNELGKQWKDDEKAGWKTMDFEQMEKPLIYKMLISAIVPRPIAFVSTISETGVPNLAPFSYFSLVSHNPPLVSVSFTLPSAASRVKDTRENIKVTKEFTVNIISEPFIEAANSTSVEAPPEIDEWVVSGLTPEPSDVVKPPRVRESAVSFECELFHSIDISPDGVDLPNPTNTFILGRIRRAHVRNAVLAEDGLQVNTAALRAVSRLGGTAYARVGEGFDLSRPSWREDEGTMRALMEKKSAAL